MIVKYISVALLWASSFAVAQSQITFDSLPKTIKDVVHNKFPKATVGMASSEAEDDGKFWYEISLENAGSKFWVHVTGDGKLQAVDRLIETKHLAPQILKSLKEKYPGAQVITGRETTLGNGKVRYDVRITRPGYGKRIIEFDRNGKLVTEDPDYLLSGD